MTGSVADYIRLLEQFLDRTISAKAFQAAYIDRFKNEGPLSETSFKVLEELFGGVDSFTAHAELLADNPAFYLDEERLRKKVKHAVARLAVIERSARGTT